MKIGEPMPKSFKGLRGRAGNKVFECEGKCAEDTPAAIDWTTQGAVTEVKDQGQCGSCWSFSTTGSLEGAFFLAGNDLTEFSEQMLVDCDNNGDMGCNGGLMDNAFQWIESNGGICTEQDYPYQAVGGTCASSDCTVVAGSAPTTYTDVKEHSLSSMEAAVANAPVSIAIQADQPAFQLYTSGVMDGNCGHQLDHGVLAVGYGTDADSGEDFWKIKNSWAPRGARPATSGSPRARPAATASAASSTAARSRPCKWCVASAAPLLGHDVMTGRTPTKTSTSALGSDFGAPPA